MTRAVALRFALAVAAALVAALPGRAQVAPAAPGDTLTEAAAVRRAVESSPAARAARARLDAAGAARAAGRTFLAEAPEAEASTTLGPTLLPESDANTTEATVAATFERPAVRRARRAAADAAFDRAAAEARATLDGLVYETRARYADLAAAASLARLADTLLADADTLLAAVALRYRTGDVSELDLRLARLDATRAAAERDVAFADADAARAALAALLGPAAGRPVAVAAPDRLLPSTPDAATDPPALVAAKAATREAEAAARYARAARRLPTFTVRGGLEYGRTYYGRDDLRAEPAVRDGFDRLGRTGLDVLVGVAVPLPFGGPARAGEAAEVGAALAADAAGARVRLRAAQGRRARYADARADVAESLALLRTAYAGGEIGLQDLLTARARVYETVRAARTADADAARAALDLARATGTVAAGFLPSL